MSASAATTFSLSRSSFVSRGGVRSARSALFRSPGGSRQVRGGNVDAVAVVGASRTSARAMSGKVAVTGASGRTGSLVFKKLVESGEGVVGIVTSDESKAKLLKATPGADEESVKVCDITSGSLTGALEGCDSLVVLTSAVPSLKKRTLLPFMILNKLFGMTSVRMGFRWKRGQTPEVVDFIGGKAQINAAIEAGVKKVVWVGSMGGTNPDNFLNTIGKDEDGKNGDILLWKRKAEHYLSESGLDYTIIHPGGLLDKEGGVRELAVGVNDTLLERKYRSIPREDVADVVIASLTAPEATSTSFDICSIEPEKGSEPIKGGAAKAIQALKDLPAYSWDDVSSISVPSSED